MSYKNQQIKFNNSSLDQYQQLVLICFLYLSPKIVEWKVCGKNFCEYLRFKIRSTPLHICSCYCWNHSSRYGYKNAIALDWDSLKTFKKSSTWHRVLHNVFANAHDILPFPPPPKNETLITYIHLRFCHELWDLKYFFNKLLKILLVIIVVTFE